MLREVVLDARMEREELEELDRRLRLFANDNGMAWVVDELDEAIEVGVFERRELRQASRQGRTTYEVVPDVARAGRKRPEEFVSRRALTPEEQVRMMLGGLRRVLSELDLVATTSVLQLNDLDSITQSPADTDLTEPIAAPRAAPPVTEIDFAPDEGSTADDVSTEGLRHSDRSNATAEVLRRIELEVQS
jgi:hypothetical protein